MRFVVREQSYEKPIISGALQYEQNGRPTGAVEQWRLTTAVPGYQVLRVDLDARAAPSGHSYLYHLVRQENGRPERLSFRFWGNELRIEGTLVFDETAVSGTRTVNGHTFEVDQPLPPRCVFWFPSTIGLGLLAPLGTQTAVAALTLSTDFRSTHTAFALEAVTLQLTTGEIVTEWLDDTEQAIRPLRIEWHDQQRTLWLNDNNWPLQMQRQDGLTAVQSQFITYR